MRLKQGWAGIGLILALFVFSACEHKRGEIARGELGGEGGGQARGGDGGLVGGPAGGGDAAVGGERNREEFPEDIVLVPAWVVKEVETLNADNLVTSRTTYEYNEEGELDKIIEENRAEDGGFNRKELPVNYVSTEGSLSEAVIAYPLPAEDSEFIHLEDLLPEEERAEAVAALAELTHLLEENLGEDFIRERFREVEAALRGTELTAELRLRAFLEVFRILVTEVADTAEDPAVGPRAEALLEEIIRPAIERAIAEGVLSFRFILNEYAPRRYRIAEMITNGSRGADPRFEFEYDPQIPSYPATIRAWPLDPDDPSRLLEDPTVQSLEYNESTYLKKRTRDMTAFGRRPFNMTLEIHYNDRGFANRHIKSNDGVVRDDIELRPSVNPQGRLSLQRHRYTDRPEEVLRRVDFLYDENGNLQRKCIYPGRQPRHERCERYQYIQLPSRPALWQILLDPLRTAVQGVETTFLEEGFLR